jgi:hypothetical protein
MARRGGRPAHGERLQAAEDGARVADGGAGQDEIGQAAEQGRDGEPCLQKGQRRAGAEVRAEAEGVVLVGVAPHVQSIRVGKLGGS